MILEERSLMAARTKAKVSPKHKTSNQRRSWRKLYLGIDGDGYIIASALTDRLEPRAGCTDTSASLGTISEQSIASLRRRKR
jgi:hypothetical protein